MDESKRPIDPSRPPLTNRVIREAWEFLRILLVALAIVIPVRYFIAQPFIVKGASMEPAYEERDYLVIDELSYYFREPARGEVVVFRFPLDPSEYFIKRVIGLPGETVMIEDGKVLVDSGEASGSRQLEERYLEDGLETSGRITQALGLDEYFVLGDNRTYSLDSRRFGVLPRKNITGRVLLRVWPARTAGFAAVPAY
ncbi:MAG: Signal peptidase I [Parcubacteria group bacterium GW2011_GWB1_52_7]|nr:MAG: Signal peptidase I [Parcubacteria group bacterium GW2011_GWA1_51_12]KKW28551.1 MAG: Signal peptidase I [Parcubacteria group bacterium GW2011_GWB1_52_7]